MGEGHKTLRKSQAKPQPHWDKHIQHMHISDDNGNDNINNNNNIIIIIIMQNL